MTNLLLPLHEVKRVPLVQISLSGWSLLKMEVHGSEFGSGRQICVKKSNHNTCIVGPFVLKYSTEPKGGKIVTVNFGGLLGVLLNSQKLGNIV